MEIAERYCSFCGAPREEAEFLIVDDGKTISICGGCVERSRDFIGHGRIAKEFSEFIKDAKRYRVIRVALTDQNSMEAKLFDQGEIRAEVTPSEMDADVDRVIAAIEAQPAGSPCS